MCLGGAEVVEYQTSRDKEADPSGADELEKRGGDLTKGDHKEGDRASQNAEDGEEVHGCVDLGYTRVAAVIA